MRGARQADRLPWNRIGRRGRRRRPGLAVHHRLGSDPLYTISMIHGLVEQGPGHAWKARFFRRPCGGHRADA
jgi:hypothetical protein